MLIPFLHWQDWVETRLQLLLKGRSTAPPPPQELFVNLRVLWNKAISSLDPSSPVYEGFVMFQRSNDGSANNITSATLELEPLRNCRWWTYRLLPPTTRWVLSIIPSSLFPRWFHANIELRTAYLNRAVDQLIDRRMKLSLEEEKKNKKQEEQDDQHENHKKTTPNTKIRLVILGAGYDTRSIRLLQQERVDQVWEFDLPSVMESKRWLLKRRGLWKLPLALRKYDNGKVTQYDLETAESTMKETNSRKLECIGLDLNQPENFREALNQLLAAGLMQKNQESDDDDCRGSFSSSGDEWYTIVISEALFLYLEPDIPAQLLTICQDLLGQRGNSREKEASGDRRPSSVTSSSSWIGDDESPLAFCFADRILEVPLEQAHDANALQQWFDKIGWTLIDWMAKEGATRQMGISRPN